MYFLKYLFALAFSLFPVTCISQTSINLTKYIADAQNDNPDSQEKLISYYNNQQNYTESVKWCNILLNNKKSNNRQRQKVYEYLGIFTLKGKGGITASESTAINYWEKGNDLGCVNCATLLAEYYLLNNSSQNSFKWLQKSANLGNRQSSFILGKLYELGHGTIKAQINKNSPIGNVSILCQIDISPKGNYTKSLYYYERYIAGSLSVWINGAYYHEYKPSTIYKVATWYFEGRSGINKDYKKAVEYYKSIIYHKRHLIKNIYNYITYLDDDGRFYYLPEGEYELSGQDLSNVYWNLSTCYRFGRGVIKSELLANQYVQLAAKLGNAKAIKILNN